MAAKRPTRSTSHAAMPTQPTQSAAYWTITTIVLPVKTKIGLGARRSAQEVKQCASNEFCCNLDSSKDCCSNNAERFSLDSPKPSTGTSDSSSSTSTPVGAIAGGVVGGIVAIALVLGLIWWLLRRKKKQTETSTPLKGAYDGEDTTSKTPDGSISAQQPLVEADAGPEAVLVESDARPVQPSRVHELPA
ncbi:hypothetical protein FALBO_12925 [Fusarium albosuccineum]|uniref:Uncharacterized protein n=1 Tax=Fusarium albosuccineum TaxID=1237068 RepID=A0A8H4KZS3_9HYPO|nr:hypothetical protein FALBO_12925 [Fusarium albosuccineum]